MLKKFINKLINKDKVQETDIEKDKELEDEKLADQEKAQVEEVEEVEEIEEKHEVEETFDNKVEEQKEPTLEIQAKIEDQDTAQEELEEASQPMEDISLTLSEESNLIEESTEPPVHEQVVQLDKEEDMEPVSLFKRLKEGLSKTKQGITGKVDNLLRSYKKIDEELFEELEEILITSDIGVNTTMEIIDGLRDKIKAEKVSEPEEVKLLLKEALVDILNRLPNSEVNIEPSPAIVLVVGVNGVGKTTSIGKMAHRFKQDGKKVLLAAGDTFRAAASEQLEIWGNRVGVEVIKHQEGSDPAAVIFDAIQAAKARKADVLICDTAGRLHNKKNLMNELGKVFKVVDREYHEATKEVLLVLDATTGQNAVQQAKTFKEVANITGLVLTKLDGTAKGGVVIGISQELTIPVKLIGVGEQMGDLQLFNAADFVEALFGEE